MQTLEPLITYLANSNAPAWLVLSVRDRLQYGGNDGYSDVDGCYYRWDSTVQNHRMIEQGHLLVVWDKYEMMGVGFADEIFTRPSSKIRHRCPRCNSPKIKQRSRIMPTYRCECGEQFENPLEETIDIVAYVGLYGSSWVPLRGTLDAKGCRQLSSQPRSQLSIRPIDKSRLLTFLTRLTPQPH